MPDNEILRQLRQGYDMKRGKIVVEVNETLFQNLIVFASGGLEVFYDNFMESERYQLLKVEVEKQEILYNVLRRYDLI